MANCYGMIPNLVYIISYFKPKTDYYLNIHTRLPSPHFVHNLDSKSEGFFEMKSIRSYMK